MNVIKKIFGWVFSWFIKKELKIDKVRDAVKYDDLEHIAKVHGKFLAAKKYNKDPFEYIHASPELLDIAMAMQDLPEKSRNLIGAAAVRAQHTNEGIKDAATELFSKEIINIYKGEPSMHDSEKIYTFATSVLKMSFKLFSK